MYIILTSVILECLILVDVTLDSGAFSASNFLCMLFNCVCSQSLKLYGSTFKLRFKVYVFKENLLPLLLPETQLLTWNNFKILA